MLLSAIVAMDRSRLIGRDNALPWRLPSDLKRFRAITLGKPVVMGRKTYESIGKPLAKRRNIVLTRDPGYAVAEGCERAGSFDEAVRMAEAGGAEECVVIGGAGVFAEAMARVDRVYLTVVEGAFEGDTHFPRVDLRGWRAARAERVEASESEPHAQWFVVLERGPGEGGAPAGLEFLHAYG